MRLLFIFIFFIEPFQLFAQGDLPVTGILTDEQTSRPLPGASISIYRGDRTTGAITNADGKFSFAGTAVDSVKFSMIGYGSILINGVALKNMGQLQLKMKPVLVTMEEVVIRPMTAKEIVEASIEKTMAMLANADFENKVFYREVIKDGENYFSVAEAIFRTQYFIKDRSFKLSMEKGRSKEDGSYTRLFEDYHPGGGPEALADKYLAASLPDFFNLKKTKWFTYKKDSVTFYDGRKVFIIGFDQNAAIHEALDKGRLFINADDLSLLKYESENSPAGMAYVKNLTGADKLFAGLLNIDFKRKGWKKMATFIRVSDKLYLSHALAEYRIGYKQPKKQLDLDLTINSELMVTEPVAPIEKLISKSEEWKRKNIVANLPTDFDPNFWGAENVISPTKQVDEIIAGISGKNNEENVLKLDGDWLYHQPNMFVAYRQHDTVSLAPVMKSGWEDDETAGMLYKEMKGDFIIEAKLDITKRTDAGAFPDNGFQQAGIIIRNAKGEHENSVLLCIGTAGNPNAKIILHKTEDGKTKGPVDKIEWMNGWLRLEKKESAIAALFKTRNDSTWKKITTYQVNWQENDTLQVGIMVMARFAGNGPKMKPDMKAAFTQLKIISE